MNIFDKKYRVLLVHNFYQKPGGEDTVFRNEKKLLEDNGHEVITYTRDNSELKSNIFKKILLPFITIFNPKTYIDVKKIIKDQNIDIVHVHNTLSLISPSVFYAAVKMKTPVVQTLHNFRMQCMNALFYRDGHICEDCISKGLYCALKHKCYRNSFIQTLALVLMTKIHRITGIYKKINYICLTDFNKSKLLQINNKKKIIDENKVFVKSNFVFASPQVRESNIINNDNSKSFYLYVGRLDEIKGIDIVLEAFSRMPDKELRVVGSGGDEYKIVYNKYANIEFLGQMSYNKVIEEMSNAYGLLFCSKWYETFGMVIVEAFSVGLPVIASDVGNSVYIVREKIHGVHFKSNNVSSLINALNIFESLNINELKKNVLYSYKNNFDKINNYELLIKIYNHLLY